MTTPWRPSGAWLQQLRKALYDAFNDVQLEMLTSDYFHPETFTRIAPAGLGMTFEYRLFQFVDWARMNDYLPDLLSALRERRPQNARFAELAQDLGLTVTGGPRLDNPTGRALEEIIQEQARFLNPATIVERLGALEGQVCQLVIPGGGGTGFLVGPDLVLTNQHVVRRIEDNLVRATDVRAVFDYREVTGGAALQHKKPVAVALADPWRVGSWGPSEFDVEPGRGDARPDEVDAALIRLAEPIGDLPRGGSTGGPDAPRRGWVDATSDPPAMAAGNQVFLLQHPRQDPLRLSIGSVTAFNAAGTRMRYDANSRDGSSGSPCFDADLQLVALHHARDPQGFPPAWNQAVPIELVQQVLTKEGIVLSGNGG
jgi:Trypsin-like peptidase domain/Effector-associated domain 1